MVNGMHSENTVSIGYSMTLPIEFRANNLNTFSMQIIHILLNNNWLQNHHTNPNTK